VSAADSVHVNKNGLVFAVKMITKILATFFSEELLYNLFRKGYGKVAV